MVIKIEILDQTGKVPNELRHELTDITSNAARILFIDRRQVEVTGIQLTTRREDHDLKFDKCTLLYNQNGHGQASRTYPAETFLEPNFQEIFRGQYH